MSRRVVCVMICATLAGLPACALRSSPVGTWDLTEGDLGLPFLKKGWWLAILPGQNPEEVVVYWDNGLSCMSAPGTIDHGRIRVLLWGTPVEISKGSLSGAKIVSTTGEVVRMRRRARPFTGCE